MTEALVPVAETPAIDAAAEAPSGAGELGGDRVAAADRRRGVDPTMQSSA